MSERVSADRILVVVPTYDEAETIEALVSAIFTAVPRAHVLVVDDASPDGTGAIADGLAAADDRVHALHRAGKRGLGTAYLDGFAWGLARGFDVLVEMDADFSHDPTQLPRLLAVIDDGADVAIGSRGVAGGGIVGWGPLRYLVSKGGSLYARAALGLAVRDLTSGFKAYRREALLAIDLAAIRSNGYAFQIETTARAVASELNVREVPIVFRDRRAGRSKMGFPIVIEAIAIVWRLRLSRGMSAPLSTTPPR